MFAALYVDGVVPDLCCETLETVSLEFDSDTGPTHRCRACGEELTETVAGYVSTSGDRDCVDADPDDGVTVHDAERVPLSWCNSAGIRLDESQDSVTVMISVGDPRGAFVFTVRRVPDDVDSDLAGQLVMYVPYPGEPAPHMPLSPLMDGTYLVGDPQRVAI
jgi:hypothetical protein